MHISNFREIQFFILLKISSKSQQRQQDMKLNKTLLILSVFGFGLIGCTSIETSSTATSSPTSISVTATADQIDLPDASALTDIDVIPEDDVPATTSEETNADAVLEVDAPEIIS